MEAFRKVSEWAPFKIDALGLATLLGAAELDLILGTLLRSRCLEFMPTLSSYVTVGNYFTKPMPGFALYNITDGIYATDVSAWFCRWLLAQDLKWNSSTVEISLRKDEPHYTVLLSRIWSLLIFLGISTGTLVIAGLTTDEWGLANAIAMAILGLTRWINVEQFRNAIDKSAQAPGSEDANVKVLCTLPNGKLVTIYSRRSIVVDCVLTNWPPTNTYLFHLTRAVGWLSFGVHIIALGMAKLVNQMIAIVLLVGTSLLIIYGVDIDYQKVGKNLLLSKHDPSEYLDRRSEVYARLKLSDEEEKSLEDWALLPRRSNIDWWRKYENLKKQQKRS